MAKLSASISIYSQWLKLNPGQSLGNLHGIVRSSDGRIWIQNSEPETHRSGVFCCSPSGEILDHLQSDLLPRPHGLELYFHPIHGETLLHTDNQKGVLLMGLDGTVHWHLEKPEFYRLAWTLAYELSNCAVASDGTIYMGDGYGSGYVVKIDSDGNEESVFAGPRSDGRGVVHPHGIGVHLDEGGEERLLVFECHLSTQDPALMKRKGVASCLKVYDLEGEYLDRIDFDTVSPRHLRPSPNGGYLCPDFQGRLLFLDEAFQLKASIGLPFERFSRPCDVTADLGRPHDGCWLGDGELLVTDFKGRVHHLKGV